MRVDGSRTGKSLERTSLDQLTDKLLGRKLTGLQYLFAAEGAGRVRAADGKAFEAIDLPSRGHLAVPASSPEWQMEDLGGLELIRITPRWPANEASA